MNDNIRIDIKNNYKNYTPFEMKHTMSSKI